VSAPGVRSYSDPGITASGWVRAGGRPSADRQAVAAIDGHDRHSETNEFFVDLTPSFTYAASIFRHLCDTATWLWWRASC